MSSQTMRRLLLLTLPLVVFLSTTGTIVVAEAKRTPDWHKALRSHLPTTALLQVNRAAQPWALSEDLRFHIAGTNKFSARHTPHVLPDDPATRIIRATKYVVTVPQPAQEIYCVLVRQGASQQVLLLGYHTDTLWQSDWVVYEADGKTSAAQLQDALHTLGCQLNLDER